MVCRGSDEIREWLQQKWGSAPHVRKLEKTMRRRPLAQPSNLLSRLVKGGEFGKKVVKLS
jgi:hypothetical protein